MATLEFPAMRTLCDNTIAWDDGWIKLEYQRLRRRNWRAVDAIRAARINCQWDELEAQDLLRVIQEPEIDWYEFDPSVDSKYKSEVEDRINREGYWIYLTQMRMSVDNEWETVDSCGGFIGFDWHDSGYDIDMKLAAIQALDDAYQFEANEMAERATYAMSPFLQQSPALPDLHS